MNKTSFNKYRSGAITIEAKSLIPEKFINLLWRNNVSIKKINKVDISTLKLTISLKDYKQIEEIARRTGTKIKIIDRSGRSFIFLAIKRRTTFIIGIIMFAGIIYFLSTFIWTINITGDHFLSPYEIRLELKNLGVKPGINKKDLNVYNIEEKLVKNNDNIMWVKVRIQGSILVVSTAERQSPPEIIEESDPCNLIAKKDGVVVRVYTKAGTSVVKKGDIIKKGDILVKGEQGKEGAPYPVHASGSIFCTTFYEGVQDVKTGGTQLKRTGNKISNYYINIFGKRVYFKKSINNYNKYDKIDTNKYFMGTEEFYETKQVPYQVDVKQAINNTEDELYKKILTGIDKSVKTVDKVVSFQTKDDMCSVRVLVICEEDLAAAQKIQ